MSWFWSKETPSESTSDKEIDKVEKVDNFETDMPKKKTSIIDELKNFHLNNTLTPVPKNDKPVQKKNEVWQEVLEIRKRVLKLESPDITKKCLGERVKTLEETVRTLEETIKRLENSSNTYYYTPPYTPSYTHQSFIPQPSYQPSPYYGSQQIVENYPMFDNSIVKQYSYEDYIKEYDEESVMHGVD
jgi:hypothetical protein